MKSLNFNWTPVIIFIVLIVFKCCSWGDREKEETPVPINNTRNVVERFMNTEGAEFYEACQRLLLIDSLDNYEKKIEYLQTHVSREGFEKYAAFFEGKDNSMWKIMAGVLSENGYGPKDPMTSEEWHLLLSRWAVLYPDNPMLKVVIEYEDEQR